MSEKRRDHKNRILRTGENQRSNLSYMYRYKDQKGKRCTVYAPTLEALRRKEEEIQKMLQRGMYYDGNKLTVSELGERYIKQNVRAKSYSRQTQKSILNRIKRSDLANVPIAKIKTSMAKEYITSLTKEDISYGTMRNVHVFLKSIFQYALEDDMVYKNPFDFKFGSLISGTKGKANGLSVQEQDELLKYISGNTCFSKRLDDVIILMGTGMRIGEFCALTKNDIDLQKRTISITKQIQRYAGGIIKVTDPKTVAGVRKLPMNDDVFEAICRVLQKQSQRRVEPMIDGVVGFLFLNHTGNVAVPHNYESYFRRVEKGFNATHTLQIRVTPHVLRHTYCTTLVRGGINPASLQYLMGHSNASISLNVYTDKTFEDAEIAYKKAIAAV